MRILIVDDDSNKASQVEAYMRQVCPSAHIEIRRSFQSGLHELVLNRPEMLLLDMTMPTYDVSQREPGGRERRYAGKEILRQLRRRGITLPVIVITQYEQFEEHDGQITLAEMTTQLFADFPESFKGAVFYQASDTAWSKELFGHLKALGVISEKD